MIQMFLISPNRCRIKSNRLWTTLLFVCAVMASSNVSAQSDFGVGVAYNSAFGGPTLSVRYQNAQVLIGYDISNYRYLNAYGAALRYNQPILRWKRFNFEIFAQVDPGRLSTWVAREIINDVEIWRGSRQFYWDDTDWRYSGGGSAQIKVLGKSNSKGLFFNTDLGYVFKKTRRWYATSPNTSDTRVEKLWRLAGGVGLHYYF